MRRSPFVRRRRLSHLQGDAGSRAHFPAQDEGGEDIEKAARMFVCDTKTDAEGKILRQKGFKKGAEWRINSVWHDAAEEPERETAIIVLFSEENHEMETVYYTYDSPDDCWVSKIEHFLSNRIF